ncbi:RNA methyltransferase [Thermobifida halotolerans]|uniref:RNA methyltransferase n=1 Tax=Thermobifida halotolerans TaxID=483545 RepID=A0A399G125_9ACTN|nr:RNA methyltransferase [Thermobifida halotolerans]UOE19395.1 RNA methyltransferase [Thermobifida halotolerans]
MTDTIVSAANPLVKRMRQLASRRYRRKEGVFLVEGAQPVWRAVEAGWDIETLVVAPDLLAGSAAARMVADQEARGTRVARLSAELFTRLSDREGPSGLAAIVRCRTTRLDDLAVGPGAVFAALHRVGNPGNLGTVVRTVDAVGGAGVVLVGETADPYAPAAVKASMGSLFAVDVASAPDADTFFAWAEANGVQVAATSGYADSDHWHAAYRTPLAVLLGSEGDGLPDDLLDRADLRVRIPMVGTAESLNLAVAAAVMLYETRRHAPGLGG